MKQLAFALDLKDDPRVIETYDAYHAAVWPDILRGMERIGVRSQRIFRTGNRLFMLVEVDDDFDWDAQWVRYMEETPRAKEWDDLMRSYQQRAPGAGAGDWWTPMPKVYDMIEQLETLAADP